MSAGFKVAGEVFWGTNGAVEAYVETMAMIAAARFGPTDPLAVYLADQWDEFSMGRVLHLDMWLSNQVARERFLGLLDAATDEILRTDTLTKYGREWVGLVVAGLRAQVVGGRPARPDAAPGQRGI